MGLSTDACGFEADFAVGEGEQAGTLGADFEVLAGHGPMPDGQIKLAGAVIAQLQSAPGKRVPTPHTEEDI